MPLLLTKESHNMDVGTIIVIIVTVLAALLALWLLIWGIVALVGLRIARKATTAFDQAFGIDPDLTIRQQHERIKRWGRNS